jgi:glycosyltransferase involved in cell wall biosynthesis
MNFDECSVVIPTYNRSRLLSYTLDSMVGQSLDPYQFEVLVVDDGSNDDTQDVVAQYRSRLNLRYFYQEDLGYRAAAARNIGIMHAETSVCVFVDSGVLLHSGALAAHLECHRGAAR